jgi:hypothetical protein
MGEVWLAEQKEPVRRRVALKLVKAGMNTREVIARFECEHQALALMEHPAIAKVFERRVAGQRSSFQLLCKLRSLGIGAEDRRAKQSSKIKSSSRGLMGFVR